MQTFSLPHRFDRYRLAGLILRHQRSRQLNVSQTELEVAAGIDQSTISRLMNLSILKEKAKRKQSLSRMNLLALTRKGFGLNHTQASLILWLAEGPIFKPWRKEEFERAGIIPPDVQVTADSKEIRQVTAFRGEPERAHLLAVALLREVFVAPPPEDGWHKVKTNVLHGNTPKDYLALYQRLKKMEYSGGQRMLVSKYPSILVSRDVENASGMLKETSEPIRSQFKAILRERQVTFDFNLKKFGERVIHSVASIKRFATESFKHSLSGEERRRRVRGLIECLEKYPRFQVGLIPETKPAIEPEVEIAIKSTREAVVRGTARDLSNHSKTVVCGPSYLHWDDEWAVVTFYLDFENEWAKLQQEGGTDRDSVLDTLNRILHASQPRRR